ncbi:hypothetical protein HY844_02220 [Candidatus Berkelbacteria bacterium]|nr:hypothetical protein [Candidatus Berkelbacteria bacterium]
MIDRVFAQAVIDKDKVDQLPGSSLTLSSLFSGAINIILTTIALVAFGSLLYSGFMYISSGGDAAKAETARKNIVWALTGVILAMLSFLLVNFFASIPETDFSGSSNNGGDNSGGGLTTTADFEVTTASGGSLGNYNIANPSQPFTEQFLINLPTKPSSNVRVSANIQGNLDLTLLDTAVIFTPENYSTNQPIRVNYSGKNTSAGSSTLTFSSGSNTKSVTFLIGND